KKANRERMGFVCLGRGETPHQTTIESTESKRCGLLRTSANRSEKPAGTPVGSGRSRRLFGLIGSRNTASTSSAFRGQFKSRSGNCTRVRCHSQQHTHLHPLLGQGDPSCGE